MRGKIHVKAKCGQRQKIKIRYLILIFALVTGTCLPKIDITAKACPDLRVVFARGSGGVRWTDNNYLAYKTAVEANLKTVKLNYEFIDLDYPAVSIGVDKLSTTIGAYIGAGETYEFGKSVNKGVQNLANMINGSSCPNTKYVIGGYSQGAMVISKALKYINPNRLLYAATFGDPKLYLPEGKGIIPPACRSKNLSEYRAYVPDCQAYKGLLGAYIPYRPDTLIGKVGIWCNRGDLFCSSRFSALDHMHYIDDHLYEEASKVAFNKITQHFHLKNIVTSPHDTVILIDSTGSMESMIDKYKAEARRLAQETLESNGRVALYDYRDLIEGYQPVEHCNFNTCTLEKFTNELANISTDGGDDTPESLLSASFTVMKKLNWKVGTTKSLVVLTDSNFLVPDRDGITMKDVVDLSKKIDPVNFYIITDPLYEDDYQELVTETDGKVVTDFDKLSLLTDYIIERNDSLPRVEETEPLTKPWLKITDSTRLSDQKVKIAFNTNAEKTLVIVNDTILGSTTSKFIEIDKLNLKNDQVILVPISNNIKGDSQEVYLNYNTKSIIPKAPDTSLPLTNS